MHVCTDVCVLVFIHVYCCCIKLKDHEQMTFDYLSAYDTHCFGMYIHSVYTCVHTYNVRMNAVKLMLNRQSMHKRRLTGGLYLRSVPKLNFISAF